MAGKEVDELVGAATLQIRGEVASRLIRGERCTLPAVLGSGAAEDNGGARVSRRPARLCVAAYVCAVGWASLHAGLGCGVHTGFVLVCVLVGTCTGVCVG